MLCVHNTTPVAEGLDRAGALAASLLSTHPVLRLEGGRFVSPLEAQDAESVNTFPVLATDADDALLGAAIMLPDHPRARAREPRRPLRRHRDRGGAAAARPRPLRRRARGDLRGGPGRARDGRPRRRGDARGHPRPARAHRALRSRAAARRAAGRDAGRGRRRHLPPGRQGRAAPRAIAPTPTTRSSTAGSPTHRAHLLRLRGQALLRRHRRRRSRPGADARDRPLPLLLHRRAGGVPRHDADDREADPRRRHRQRVAARRRLRR